MTTVAFYSVADSRFFIGVVALLNSMRGIGHREPFRLVDAGFTTEQRAVLAPHVEFIPAPEGTPAPFLTAFGPLEQPADVQVLLDADIVVTRSLHDLIAIAEGGQLVTFENNAPNHDRFFPEWSAALGLGPAQRAPYFNVGLMVVPRSLNRTFLEPLADALDRIVYSRTCYGSGTLSDPFYFGDQDVLNAIAMASLGTDRILRLEHRLAPHPPFTGLHLVEDVGALCCYDDGTAPYVLHHTMEKPWLRATPHTVYSALLPRLLLQSDVAVRLDPAQLPRRLRFGRIAAADRTRAHFQARARAGLRTRLGRFGVRTRLRAWRARHAVR